MAQQQQVGMLRPGELRQNFTVGLRRVVPAAVVGQDHHLQAAPPRNLPSQAPDFASHQGQAQVLPELGRELAAQTDRLPGDLFQLAIPVFTQDDDPACHGPIFPL